MFPLPRVLYAMANDGIIYKFLKTIHPFTKTPLKATILSGLLAGNELYHVHRFFSTHLILVYVQL